MENLSGGATLPYLMLIHFKNSLLVYDQLKSREYIR